MDLECSLCIYIGRTMSTTFRSLQTVGCIVEPKPMAQIKCCMDLERSTLATMSPTFRSLQTVGCIVEPKPMAQIICHMDLERSTLAAMNPTFRSLQTIGCDVLLIYGTEEITR